MNNIVTQQIKSNVIFEKLGIVLVLGLLKINYLYCNN